MNDWARNEWKLLKNYENRRLWVKIRLKTGETVKTDKNGWEREKMGEHGSNLVKADAKGKNMWKHGWKIVKTSEQGWKWVNKFEKFKYCEINWKRLLKVENGWQLVN